MYDSDATDRIIEEIEFIEAEWRQLREKGPHFRIIYRSDERSPFGASYQAPIAAYLVHKGRSFQVALGSVLIKLFDYMARHNRLVQTASQIEDGARAARFLEIRRRAGSRICIPRRYVRVYVERIRVALGLVLQRAGLGIGPEAVLVSEDTVMSETGYRLRGSFEWLHAT